MLSYFAAFSDFDHSPNARLGAEFERLAKLRRWGTARRRKEWARCCTQEFGHHYGTDGKLQGWQALCAEVGIKDVPASVTACRKILNRTFVNLVDLIDCRRTGEKVRTHRSANALREYTLEENRVFPKLYAKQNGFLAGLLIQIFGAPPPRKRA